MTEKENKKQVIKSYKSLCKNKEKYNLSMHEILSAFSSSKLPNWGGFKFNGQTVN